MTTTVATPEAPDVDTLRRRLRQAEEVRDDLGRRLARLDWGFPPASAVGREELAGRLESDMVGAEADVAGLRAAVAAALEADSASCRECGGVGYLEGCPECGCVRLPMPATRSCRNPRWAKTKAPPPVGQFDIEAGRKAVTYTVKEMTPDRDWDARAWTLTRGDTGEVYHVLIARQGTDCSCAGACYEAVARGNNRAYWAGDDVYGTDCCKHATALRLLLRAGLLDPAPVPAAPEPATDPFA